MSCEHEPMYSTEHDNYYCALCNAGMGTAYYKIAKRLEAVDKEIADGFDAIFPYVPEARGDNGKELSLADKVHLLGAEWREQQAKIAQMRQWVSDLQDGTYVTCVYCGHRYGPADSTPTSLADKLKEHISQCADHPMSKLKLFKENTHKILDEMGVPKFALHECRIWARLQWLKQFMPVEGSVE